MQIIGLTGGIGSGKSTLSRLLEIMDIPVYIADSESKKLTDNSPWIREKLIEKFGSDLYKTGKLDKSLLSSLIFGNEENLAYVNSVIHPVVLEDFKNWTSQHADKEFIAIESAILFDSGFNKTVDFTVNVSTPLEMRIHRVEVRDNLPRESIIPRINSQLPEKERNRRSDFIILNDDVAALIPQVEKVLMNASTQI
ncbi:dephospho-CoA kinase [Bacteroidia bacterium]|nr:dephospho-CoA kinase [Bacteroidia bacterium]